MITDEILLWRNVLFCCFFFLNYHNTFYSLFLTQCVWYVNVARQEASLESRATRHRWHADLVQDLAMEAPPVELRQTTRPQRRGVKGHEHGELLVLFPVRSRCHVRWHSWRSTMSSRGRRGLQTTGTHWSLNQEEVDARGMGGLGLRCIVGLLFKGNHTPLRAAHMHVHAKVCWENKVC